MATIKKLIKWNQDKTEWYHDKLVFLIYLSKNLDLLEKISILVSNISEICYLEIDCFDLQILFNVLEIDFEMNDPVLWAYCSGDIKEKGL